LLGIGLAVGGVMWAVAERTTDENPFEEDRGPRYYTIGVLFALGGALGQAAGLTASKAGLVGEFSALSGNMIRLVASTGVIWLIAAISGKVGDNFQKLRETPKAMIGITLGSIAGPAVGVWLSLVAVQNAPVGIASTLIALTPILLLPISYFVFKEKLGWGALFGTILAVGGTAIIFLADSLQTMLIAMR
ncbi:MAG: DMT family transporter, partial [Chloroflexi bacterium]|nr:DMT family transporter [Chloroflexota bacterium]